ncbi:MAG: biotin/lipoyl-containing protein [Chitinophagaceae bacterium]
MLQTTVNGKYQFALASEDGQWLLDSQPVSIDIQKTKSGLISVLHEGKSYEAFIENINLETKEVSVGVNSQRYTVAIQEPIDQLLKSMGLDLNAGKKAEALKAPMPGMILKILVSPGQQITKGEALIILEAMKMENVLKAASDATIKNIRAVENTAVEKGTVLIEFE